MMMRLLALSSVLILLVAAEAAVAGPAKEDRSAVQHGAQPNPGEVRPPNRDGDSPSAAAGDLVPRPERRIFGLPANAALGIVGALIVIAALGAVAIPRSRRRRYLSRSHERP